MLTLVLNAEQVLARLRADGWKVEVLIPEPKRRVHGRRRWLVEDFVRVVATRGAVKLETESLLPSDAIYRMRRKVDELREAA